MAIEVRQAIQAAREAAERFYNEPLQDLRLEEVELADDESHWLITLGFLVPDPKALHPGLFSLKRDLARFERVYKVFEVDASSGKVRSMRKARSSLLSFASQ